MFENQGWHLLFLALLLAGVAIFAQGDMLAGQLWGIRTPVWLRIAVAVPVVHQLLFTELPDIRRIYARN
jgi:hypothetical protein